MTISVEASSINNKYMYFICPHCRSRYKRDGTPHKLSKQVIHKHGNNGELHNRVEHRVGHCVIGDYDFNIHITNNTIKNDT